MARTIRVTWFALAALSVASAGCAESGGITEGAGGGAGSFAPVGQGGASTGGGGSGGGAGEGAGGAGEEWPCGVDCSAIQIEQPCLVAVCDASAVCAIVNKPDDAACDDGLFCTVDDRCQGGLCVGGIANDCGMIGGACTEPVCDEASESCSLSPVEDAKPCVSEDLCTLNGACMDGVCVGVPKDCFFAPVDDCFVAECNPQNGKCEPVPGNDGAACQNDDLCLVKGVCSGGSCGGSPKDCSTLENECNGVGCHPATGTCYRIPVAAGSACAGGTCDIMGNCVSN